MNKKDLDELYDFNDLDDTDGHQERFVIIRAYGECLELNRCINASTLKALEAEVEGYLKWYRSTFKIKKYEVKEWVVTKHKQLIALGDL